MTVKLGDSVAVKPGIADPDFGTDISGWQGRVEEVLDEVLILIRWDSLTLQEMGSALIIRCENENFDWQVMHLNVTDVDVVSPRDSEADVFRTAAQFEEEIDDDPRLIRDEER
jgi:hypothetical protein